MSHSLYTNIIDYTTCTCILLYTYWSLYIPITDLFINNYTLISYVHILTVYTLVCTLYTLAFTKYTYILLYIYILHITFVYISLYNQILVHTQSILCASIVNTVQTYLGENTKNVDWVQQKKGSHPKPWTMRGLQILIFFVKELKYITIVARFCYHQKLQNGYHCSMIKSGLRHAKNTGLFRIIKPSKVLQKSNCFLALKILSPWKLRCLSFCCCVPMR